MAFVSVTRLRVRSLRFMPGFLIRAAQANAQIKSAPGFMAGALLPDKRRTFWTLTLWTDAAAARAYQLSGAHRAAMPKLVHWCDEASVVHWTQKEPTLPDWATAERRMRAEGRVTPVKHPSPDHALAFAAPDISRAVPLRPRRVAER